MPHFTLNEAILIEIDGLPVFGVLVEMITRMRIPGGETTSLVCEVFSGITPAAEITIPENRAYPLSSFTQYGGAAEFWKSFAGYQWAKAREDQLNPQAAAVVAPPKAGENNVPF